MKINKKNLKRMIAHMKTVPQEMLRMEDYRTGGADHKTNACDTPACVIGHCAVLSGNKVDRYDDGAIDFTGWSLRFLNFDNHCSDNQEAIWAWMFASHWQEVDNSVEGAILRMQYILDHEAVPDNFNWEEFNPIDCDKYWHPYMDLINSDSNGENN